MKIAYMALGVFCHENHAGYTHHYNISKFMSAHNDATLFFSSTGAGVSRESGPRVVTLAFPTSGLFFPHPVELGRSVGLAVRELDGTDIVHERFRHNPLELVLARGKKYVLEFNDPAVDGYAPSWKILRGRVLRNKLRRCDAIVTQTATLERHIRRITDKPIHIVPNGVDTEMFKPRSGKAVRKQLGLGEDDITVTYVGSFRSWHGISMIISAAEHFFSTKKRIKFILVGSGQYYADARRASQGFDNVILTGGVPMGKVPTILAGSDICIAPFSSIPSATGIESDFWWCPIKLFEYMASGKPIVTTCFEEVNNIVENSALTFRPGDAADFTAKLTSLVDDRDRRIDLGRKARNLAVSKHSWEQRTEMLSSIYASL